VSTYTTRYVYQHEPTWFSPTGSMFWDACWWMTTIPMFILMGKAIAATVAVCRKTYRFLRKGTTR